MPPIVLAWLSLSLMLMFHRATGCRVLDGADTQHRFTCRRSALQSPSAGVKFYCLLRSLMLSAETDVLHSSGRESVPSVTPEHELPD